jgi:shikimate dehydrogenase
MLSAGYRKIHIANRTLARAEDLALAFGPKLKACRLADYPKVLKEADLIVNTTSLGMEGKEAGDFDLSAAADTAIAADIVYVPLETPFLAAARRRGLRTVDGLGMLLHQAVPGFERWFGIRPVVDDELRAHLLALLERRRDNR